MPTDFRQPAHWFLALAMSSVVVVASGCQTYPVSGNPESAYVIFPDNALPPTQISNLNRPFSPSPAQPPNPSDAFAGNSISANPQPRQPAVKTYPAAYPQVQQASYQYPATNPPANFQAPANEPVIGFQPSPISPNLNAPSYPANQNFNPVPLAPPFTNPPVIADIDVNLPIGPTGRASVGATYGSNNGLVGQLVIDERDFDILNWPRVSTGGFQPNTWRGGGQTFRAEIVPGNKLERYLINWANPYFRGSALSLSVSGYYFDRQYFDYDEQRSGGRIGLGRTLTDYLSINTALRLESVTLDNPRVNTSPELNANLGNSNLFVGSVGLEYDTRINPYNRQPDPFVTSQGTYLGLTFKQAFGDYSYSRGDIDFRRHRVIYSRPDGSGRHTIGLRTNLGFTGSSTPVFETYLAGGVSSLRGFEFRGVSPLGGGVRVGGDFQWLNSLEYLFPLTADDMIAGVMFVDFGTVEESVKLSTENFRTAPGIGLRVNLPYAGLGAPLAFDWAFPVATATGDQEQTFSFLVGVVR